MSRLAAAVCALCLAALPQVAGAYAFFGQPAVAGGNPQPLQTEGTPIVWPAGKVGVEMTLNFTGDFRDSMLDAMQTGWNAAGTPLQFSEGTSAADPCDNDGINAAGWRATTCNNAAFGDALAVTLVTHTRRNGRWEISDMDIIVDQGRPWSSRRTGVLAGGQYDFHRVAVHELGHALGLEHPDDAGERVTAIMNSRVSEIETLQTDDIQGIEFLYEGTDSRSSSLSRSDSDNGGADAALGLLVLLGWGARRAFYHRGRRGMMRVRRDGKA